MAKATNLTPKAFHVPDAKYTEYTRNTLSHAVEENRITSEDAALIEEFTGEIAATSQISPSRKFKITCTLVGWRRFIGPFRENGIGDLYAGWRGYAPPASRRTPSIQIPSAIMSVLEAFLQVAH